MRLIFEPPVLAPENFLKDLSKKLGRSAQSPHLASAANTPIHSPKSRTWSRGTKKSQAPSCRPRPGQSSARDQRTVPGGAKSGAEGGAGPGALRRTRRSQLPKDVNARPCKECRAPSLCVKSGCHVNSLARPGPAAAQLSDLCPPRPRGRPIPAQPRASQWSRHLPAFPKPSSDFPPQGLQDPSSVDSAASPPGTQMLLFTRVARAPRPSPGVDPPSFSPCPLRSGSPH